MSHLICLFIFSSEIQPDSVLLLSYSVAIDDNQVTPNHPFISYPFNPNTPADGPLTPTSDFFPTPNPDPFCDDPFTLFSNQSDSVFSYDKDSGLSSFILNGPDSILKDCTSDIKHLNGLCNALNVQEHTNHANFSLNPFCSTSLNNPIILNGLYKSAPSVLHSPLLCNGPSESIPLFQTSPISNDGQNGGLVVLSPPPQSLKSRSIRRREKVNILK